jgi:hypothetical protein
MPNNKRSVDTSGLPPELSQIASRDPTYDLGRIGAFGAPSIEPQAKYITSPSEQSIDDNDCIIIGNDRPASRASGYGGQGHTQSKKIDICVGRGGGAPVSELYYDPNFSSDAARMYISEKTDIDANFNLANGKQGASIAKSGIAIKADGVRVVGRDGIKLITRTEPKNSKGGTTSHNGIELIACNDDSDLQRMVKGDNLIEALEDLTARVNELGSIVLNHINSQLQFNTHISSHTHPVVSSPFGSGVASISPPLSAAGTQASAACTENMTENFFQRTNIQILWKNNYLNPVSKKYICSRYNKVN